MSNTQTKGMLGAVVLVGWTFVACTAGVGSAVDIGESYGDSPGAFGTNDRPGVSNQDPANGPPANGGEDDNDRDNDRDDDDRPPTGTGGSSGSSGSSGTSTGGDCPPCDGAVSCELTISGQTSRATLPLKTKNGACVTESQSGDVVFACGGQITQNGQSVGSWKNCTKSTSPTPTPPPTTTDAGTSG